VLLYQSQSTQNAVKDALWVSQCSYAVNERVIDVGTFPKLLNLPLQRPCSASQTSQFGIYRYGCKVLCVPVLALKAQSMLADSQSV